MLRRNSRFVTILVSVAMSTGRRRSRQVAAGFTLFCVAFMLVLRRQRIQTLAESRHPLSFVRRMNEVDSGGLRYLSFGSFTGLGDDADNSLDAYPHQLSPDARTVASKSDVSVLSAACTQSIVGERHYDVITIEFQHFGSSHSLLAERLRERFPRATIIFVRLWNPSQIEFRKDSETRVDFDTWRLENGNLTLHSPALPFAMLESGSDNWSVFRPDETLVQSTMSRVGGKFYSLPVADSKTFSFPKNLQSFFALFEDESSYSLSTKGQKILAIGIRRIVTDAKAERHDELGSWGSGDQCNVWYANGQYAESTGRRLGFSHTATGIHKHAIEFRHKSAGQLTVNNPFPKDRMLYLTYMTASDEEMNRIYPRTRVLLNGRGLVVVDPYHDASEEWHLTRTSAVGMIPAGETTVQFDPLESSSLNFRLVGASLISEEASHLSLDFAFEAEPAKVAPGFPWSW